MLYLYYFEDSFNIKFQSITLYFLTALNKTLALLYLFTMFI